MRPQILALGDRQRRVEAEDFLELVDAIDLGAHRDVGDAFQDELQHHRHLVFRHERVGAVECVLELVRALHPDRLAAKPFGHCHMVHAIAAYRIAIRRSVDVVERQADFEVHLEAALGLADQA